jgi:succinate dehydrogenase / fumarate reductase, membrane anchor subunit
MKSSSIRTNLKNARGLGAAHDGTHHFWLERITALALVPLSVWFIITFVGQFITDDRAAAAGWFTHPVNALLTAIFFSIMFLHSRLGVQVMIEDYVHHEGKKLGLLIFSSALHILFGTASLVAIAHLHFNGI